MAVFQLDNLGAWADKVKTDTDKLMRALSLDILGRVVKRTPVDTGRARANWHVALRSPDTRITDAVDKNRKPKKNEIPVRILPDAIYITNNLEYILPLEHGSSKKAPGGMVGVTINEWQQKVDKVIAQKDLEDF